MNFEKNRTLGTLGIAMASLFYTISWLTSDIWIPLIYDYNKMMWIERVLMCIVLERYLSSYEFILYVRSLLWSEPAYHHPEGSGSNKFFHRGDSTIYLRNESLKSQKYIDNKRVVRGGGGSLSISYAN